MNPIQRPFAIAFFILLALLVIAALSGAPR